MKRKVNKEKKANIKCEHCDSFMKVSQFRCKCNKTGELKQYYQRCKDFEWRKDI